MMLRRYHNVKQEVQAVEKPPVKSVDVEEKPKRKYNRRKKEDTE